MNALSTEVPDWIQECDQILAEGQFLSFVEEPDIRASDGGRNPLYPQSFAEFIGQAALVRLLRLEVEACRLAGRCLDHTILYGPPGLGKTAMAHVLAGELGMSIYESSGAEFPTQKEILQAFARCSMLHVKTGKPILWLIDELDGMPRIASYPLFSLMTHGYITWEGTRLGGFPVSLFATTNRAAGVTAALVNRFANAFYLGYYTPSELTQIAKQVAPKRGFALDDAGAAEAGANGGGEPRKICNMILKNAQSIVLRDGLEVAGEAAVREAVELSGLRRGGLTEAQFRYLEFLHGVPDMRAGLPSIGAYLGMAPRDVQYNEEPYLIRSRLVVVTRGGRRLTEKGREYLGGIPGSTAH